MNIRLLMLSLLIITITGCSQDEAPEQTEKTVAFDLQISGSALDILSESGSQDMQLFYRLIPAGWSSRSGDTTSIEYTSMPIKDGSIHITLPESDGKTYVAQFWLIGGNGKGYTFNESGILTIDTESPERGPVWYAERRVATDEKYLTLEFASALSRVCIWTTQEDWEAAMRAGLREDELTATLIVHDGDTIPNSVTVGEPRTLQDGSYRTLFETDVVATANGTLDCELVLEGDDDLRNVIPCNHFPVGPGKYSVLAGRFLTVDVTFNITISPSFDGEYNAGL